MAVAAAPAQAAAPQLWAAGLGRDNLPLLGNGLAQKARAAGLNTLLVDQARLSRHQAQRIHVLVTRFGFRKILSPHAPARSVKRGAKACSAVKKKHPKRQCTVVARTFEGARRLAIKPQVDLVVVRRNQLPRLAQLQALHGSRGRVVVLVRIGRGRSLQTAAWRAAIAQAAASDFFDLAVAPVRAHGSRLLEQYLGLLGQGSAPPPPPPPPPPSPMVANLWVNVTGGTCTRSTTRLAYNPAGACGSFEAAYSAAASGDLVGVKAGTYPPQFFAGGSGGTQGSGTKTLTFSGEAGTILRQLHTSSPNLTFSGLDVNAGGAQLGGGDGAVLEMGNADHGTFENGSVGNVVDQKGAIIDGDHWTINHVLFHDVVLATNGVHSECIFAEWNPSAVIENSTFRHCPIMDISLGYPTYWDPLPPSWNGMRIENNVFGKAYQDNNNCCGAYSVAIWSLDYPNGSYFGVMHNWTIRNNYVEPGSSVIVRPSADGTNVFCGNTGNVPAEWLPAC